VILIDRCVAALVILSALAFAFVGCRCDNGRADAIDAGAQPTMPKGMLAPAPVPIVDAGEPLPRPARLRAYAARPTAGDWVLVRAAPDDNGRRYVSVDTMTLLHDAFARAMPGFDLFVPRRFEGDGLARLASELRSFKQEWVAIGTADDAKGKWGKTSSFILTLDGSEWIAARDALAATIDAILTLSALAETSKASLLIKGE
jgi:hypothetical protein